MAPCGIVSFGSGIHTPNLPAIGAQTENRLTSVRNRVKYV